MMTKFLCINALVGICFFTFLILFARFCIKNRDISTPNKPILRVCLFSICLLYIVATVYTYGYYLQDETLVKGFISIWLLFSMGLIANVIRKLGPIFERHRVKSMRKLMIQFAFIQSLSWVVTYVTYWLLLLVFVPRDWIVLCVQIFWLVGFFITLDNRLFKMKRGVYAVEKYE